jgi:SAM-dependent methyltransferase
MQETLPSPAFQTFRDPAGSLELRADAAYRSIRSPEAEEILAFLATPLAAQLVEQRRLIASLVLPSEPDPERSNSAFAPHPSLLLQHPRVPFASYPWEWPPALWLAAAEATLTLCRDLIPNDWILKDATPLNVLFRGCQPIFVDVLSVARLDPEQPIWFAYAQFVRMFLLPMLAYSRLRWPLHAISARRDGYEPEDLYPALSTRARLTQPALSSVTLPHLLARRQTSPGAPAAQPRRVQDPELTKHILRNTLDKLLRQMRRVTPAAQSSTWSDYAQTSTHYEDHDHARKQAFVSATLDRLRPRHVLDVGCNTGVYSNLAALAGASVVAIDTDLQTVDHLARRIQQTGQDILPLSVDLANPTPAIGWQNRENPSFLDRAAGHFDLVLMLAVIHHLLLHNQVPLDRIAALASTLTTRHLILEWVPPADPKFQELLRGRGPLYAHLTESAFRAAFARHFTVESELLLSNRRILFHFVRR